MSAPFVLHERYGTRCSTVFLAGRDGRTVAAERRFDAAEPDWRHAPRIRSRRTGHEAPATCIPRWLAASRARALCERAPPATAWNGRRTRFIEVDASTALADNVRTLHPYVRVTTQDDQVRRLADAPWTSGRRVARSFHDPQVRSRTAARQRHVDRQAANHPSRS
jgi:hypothetical protein